MSRNRRRDARFEHVEVAVMHARRRNPQQAATVVALLAVAALIAAGCGARWTDEQREALVTRAEQGPAQGSPTDPDDDQRATATTKSTRTGQGDTAAPSSGDSTADGAGATVAAEESEAAPTGQDDGARDALPCRAPSDAPGVTDDEITVGTINTLSGPVPGLGESHLAATRAHVARRNAAGGVCGRQINLITADDGADNGQHRALVDEFAPKVFGMIAGIAAGGDGGVDIIESEAIPLTGTAITPGLIAADPYFGTRPLLPSYDMVTPKHRYLHDQGVRTAAVVYIAAAAAPREAERESKLLEAAGIEVVLDRALPPTTLSYDSTARAVANSGADLLWFAHEQGASAAMARALDDAGYDPQFEEYIQAYGSKFIDLAGADIAEGATSWIDTLPNEDGGANPVQAAFLEWMQRTAPGVVRDPFAARGWVGTKTFFDILERLDGPISRDALLAELRATGTYDAGGFLGPIDLGAKENKGCLIAMTVEDGEWRRLVPAEGFLC